MAKKEFAEKEQELSRAFAKVDSLMDELSKLQKHRISGSSDIQQQETELYNLRLQLEVLHNM